MRERREKKKSRIGSESEGYKGYERIENRGKREGKCLGSLVEVKKRKLMCERRKILLVCGTTGLGDEERTRLK